MKFNFKVLNFSGQEKQSLSWETPVKKPKEMVFRGYLEVLRSKGRKGNSAIKNRGQVSGGGRKPWRQKGTGRARQGSIRSPIWRGGGVAHGPQIRNYDLKINKRNMKRVWQYVFLSKLEKEGSLVVLSPGEERPKTKLAYKFLEKVCPKSRSVHLVSSEAWLGRSFTNLAKATVSTVDDLNPFEIFGSDCLIIDQRDLEKVLKKIK